MKNLKTRSLDHCISLLREFIEEAESCQDKKGIAVLALDQLYRITAGESGGISILTNCTERPRAL